MPRYEDDMAEFVKGPTKPLFFNAYGQDLLQMDGDGVQSAFSAGFMNVVDQDWLANLAKSDEIEKALKKNVKVMDGFEHVLVEMDKEGKTKVPPPTWVSDSKEFQDEMQRRATKEFLGEFSDGKRVDPEAKKVLFECMDRFGPQSYGQLQTKLGELQDRKGELNGLIRDLQDVFEKNGPEIQKVIGIKSPDEIISFMHQNPEALPKGFDPTDIVQLGREVVKELWNPGKTGLMLLTKETAPQERASLVKMMSLENQAQEKARQPDTPLAPDPNGRFAQFDAPKMNTGVDGDDDPNNPNGTRNRLGRPFSPMLPGGGGF